MAVVYVRNMRGSSDIADTPACRCSSWIEHWNYNNMLEEPDCCLACRKHPTGTNHMVGGHVQKVVRGSNGNFVLSQYDQTHYIVPICDSCNKKLGLIFPVDDEYLAQSSKKSCIHP